MDYMTLKEAAEKWGVTPRRVNYYCAGGRIPGAVKMAGVWLIPKDAEKPVDMRTKKGRQQKERLIKPEALHEGWQTGGSARLTRLAFNLWNGYVEKGEESLSTPYEMFDCGYAPYFYEAIRIKYPEYCRDLLQVSKKETNHER